jgi:histidinol-phosphate/aromatic aminotransferase/cobyric acid decarboxylase-like protein
MTPPILIFDMNGVQVDVSACVRFTVGAREQTRRLLVAPAEIWSNQ